jgi:hypothetical protein
MRMPIVLELLKRTGKQETILKRVLLLILFFSFLIFLHAMAMSDGTDNSIENKIVYGFSPDLSRWNNYAIESDDTIYLYDTKSVIKKNDSVKVWIKFGEPINDNKETRLYKEAIALKEINCSTRLIRSIEWNYLSMRGEYNKYTSPTKWENIEPETSNDALLEEVCTQPKKVKKR